MMLKSNNEKRLFVALELSQELKDSAILLKDENPLLAKNRNIRWTKAENLHLTLCFLGNTRTSLIPKIIKELDFVARDFDSFSLSFYGLGLFFTQNRPQVIWIGVENQDLLRPLYNKTIRRISIVDNIKKPRFSPHVTLARINERASQETTEMIRALASKNETTRFGTLKVDHMSLFESILKPTGPVYKIIHKSVLK